MYAYLTSVLSSPVAVCVGMVHIICLVLSKGTHTAPDDKLKFTYIQYMFSPSAPLHTLYIHKSFRTRVNIPLAYEVCMVWFLSSTA